MKSKYHILTALAFGCAALTTLSSCANPEKITFQGPVSVDVESASKIAAECRVENCTAHKIRLISAKFTLHYPSENIATVMLAQPVEIAKCWGGEVVFPLRVRFANPLMALTAQNLEELDWDNIYVTGEGVVRAGVGKRKIRLNDYPVREFLSNFDPGRGTHGIFYER